MPILGIKMPKMGIRPKSVVTAGFRGKALASHVGTGLSDALFTKTQQRVLGLLFGQPERSFFANELIALTKSGSGAVQREMRRLTESGLATVRKVGNQTHFQANKAAPIFAELRGIILKTVGVADPMRQALAPLGDSIQLALVYGSAAKGTDTAYSDLDLLLVSDRLTLEQAYAALAPAEQEISRKINVTLYNSLEFNRRRAEGQPFLAGVLAGEHWVLVGEIGGSSAARQPRPDSAAQD